MNLHTSTFVDDWVSSAIKMFGPALTGPKLSAILAHIVSIPRSVLVTRQLYRRLMLVTCPANASLKNSHHQAIVIRQLLPG